jgi:hypothetical protein
MTDKPVANADEQKSRRGLLALIGAGGAAAVAALLGRRNGAEAVQAPISGESDNTVPGVLGTNNDDGPGVRGVNTDVSLPGGPGVTGTSEVGFGVWGASDGDAGVVGQSTKGALVWTPAPRGVWGRGMEAGHVGVEGTSAGGRGVVGGHMNQPTGLTTRDDIGVLGYGWDGGTGGVGVWGASETNTGTVGVSKDARGLHGISSGLLAAANAVGVEGQGPIGVKAVSNVADGAAILLVPSATPGAPTASPHQKGEIMVDSDGVLRICIVGGTPGTWITNGGTQLLTSPQRAFDTRQPAFGPKLTANGTRTFDIPALVPDVPATALAVVANLTVTQTVGGGYVTAYPTGTAKPITANVNWTASNQDVGNGATVRLGTGGQITVYSYKPTHLVMDVVAYIM